MSEKELPAFGIKRIKEFSFLINESLAVIGKSVRIQFQHHTTYYQDTDVIDLTIRAYYSYDTKIPPDTILVDFHVQNLFEVTNLKQYHKPNSDEFILPQNLIAAILGVAISHLRALMASNIAGTAYQENIIPIVNPMEVAKAFYPNMFKNNFDINSFEEKAKKLPKKKTSK
jgi:hypothetical protein